MTKKTDRIAAQITACKDAIAYHQSKGSDHSHLDAQLADLGVRMDEALAIDKAMNAPEVGMPASFTLWTDVIPCTIVDVRRGGKQVVLQEDKATLLNGANSGEPDALQFSAGGFAGHVSGRQRYTFERDPEGRTIVVSKRVRKDGEIVWKAVGHATKSPGGFAVLGRRTKHHDYNF